MILSQTQLLCVGLRVLQSTLLFPDVHWAIPSRPKTEIQSQRTGAVLERTDLGQWGKKFFYMYIYFSIQQESSKSCERQKKKCRDHEKGDYKSFFGPASDLL